MKHYASLFSIVFLFAFASCQHTEQVDQISPTKKTEQQTSLDYALVIHGGAGTLQKGQLSPEQEREYIAALDSALTVGETILKNGGSAEDAVVKTIMILEDCPLFNAGKGAVFTHQGTNALDASIMEGSQLKAGAVGGVTRVKNPITAAQAVMHKSPHVMLSGKGADQFASEQNLILAKQDYFFTQGNYDRLQNILKREEEERQKEDGQGSLLTEQPDSKFGTVGCAALDKNGNLAAGTSTGGMTNKRWDRIGDSPIIGAGTYADNRTCAVSCTGHGEFFIRHAVAHDLSARLMYTDQSLDQAADIIIHTNLKEIGALGGLIAVDKYGNITMPFNTSCMYRGFATPLEREIQLFKE